MIKKRLAFAVVVCLLSLNAVPVNPQVRRRTAVSIRSEILEKNVRAELGFLASDAMQGRGSGTNYERVAAEYIGSMFRQFGLEPAGDVDSTSNKGFVQRVTLKSVKFLEPLTLTAGSGNEAKRWQFGRDFLVTGMRTPSVAGVLQIVEGDQPPTKAAIALIRLPDGVDQQKRQELIRNARSAQAAAVVFLETEANKAQRESGNVRFPTLQTRIAGERPPESFAVISVRKDIFDELATMANGTPVELKGPIQDSDSNATWNAVGVLRGSDPTAVGEAIMLSAHLDHLGVSETANGDQIFNGADDDASGCVAVLELARVLAAGPQPRRTIYFVCFGSEERGGLGSRYFVDHSPVPLEKIVADVTFEMLGRPDAKVPPNTLWLTGYERSTLGPELARRGARLVADPHPEQNFFQRSDNYVLALRGVVAHTVSSFGLHTDYHRPSDDLTKIDFPFMTRSINSLVAPMLWLANSTFRPAWLPGKQPTRN
ncbi:MAG TPA: M20/M25/M40 family metallo-hydrolase [Pyrinomonadaceae bacterium]